MAEMDSSGDWVKALSKQQFWAEEDSRTRTFSASYTNLYSSFCFIASCCLDKSRFSVHRGPQESKNTFYHLACEILMLLAACDSCFYFGYDTPFCFYFHHSSNTMHACSGWTSHATFNVKSLIYAVSITKVYAPTGTECLEAKVYTGSWSWSTIRPSHF
jgi:hypothetical protein